MYGCHIKIAKNGQRRTGAYRFLASSTRAFRDSVLGTQGVLIFDEVGNVRYCNPLAAKIFGCSQLRLVGRPISALLPDLPLSSQETIERIGPATPSDGAGCWQAVRGFDPSGQAFPLEICIERPRPGKSQHHLLLRLRPIVRQRGPEDAMARLQHIAEATKHAVMISTTSGIITYVNPAFERLTGFRSEELRGEDAAIFNAGAHDQRNFEYDDLWSVLREDKNGKEFPHSFVNQKKNGEFFFMEQSIRPFVTANGAVTHYIFTGRDISQRVLALHHLAQKANHDGLTGLSNRTLFLDRLHQAFSQASRRKDRFALLYFDLDELKEVNDTYGHAAGDELLRVTALHLRQSVREVDTVARLGGDEFALILPDAKQREDVEKVVEKILDVFREGAIWENKHLAIRASIGASLYPANGDSCEQLIQRADKAMYQQKIAGGNGVCFAGSETETSANSDC